MAENHSEASSGENEPPTGAPFAPLGICARCHRPLTRPGTAGGCLHCIVNFVGLDEDFSFAAAGGSEEVRRYSHFEIALEADGTLTELGHGSMGTTYHAMDTVLHSPVALKVIGRNVADSPTVRARFLREARSAARLRHPNVASVFHYGEQEGECFYVMELVEGETLEERVRRDGPLPTASVLEIGMQVARALEAAESQGLVHRDLKPSNLMLVGGRGGDDKPGDPLLVKVIDFGLAKAIAGGDKATGENDTRHGFVGTPAYASPEQFSAGDHRVDTRSDLYSLGVTLWYLLCGRTPFRGATLEEIHRQQTRDAVPVDQLAARRVPGPVIALLRSLLAVDPRQRPQSSRELIESLKRCQGALVPGRHAPRRWITAAMVFSLAALAAFLAVRERSRPAGPAGSPGAAATGRSVAVLPFENLSSDPAEAFFTTGMHDEINANLAQIAELKTIGTESTQNYLPGKRDLPKIGRELGVSHLVEGSVRRAGDEIRMSVRLIPLADGGPPWSGEYTVKLSEVPALQEKVTLELADHLGITPSVAEINAIGTPRTADPVAHDLYLQGTAPEQRLEPLEWQKDAHRRLDLFEEAVKRDPSFVLAFCEIAGVHDSLYQATDALPDERSVDHGARAEVALQQARRLRPGDGNVHLATAHHLRVVVRDNEQAEIELNLARRTLPNNWMIEHEAGTYLRREGRWKEAVAAYERSIALNPKQPADYSSLLEIDRCLRQYEDAQSVLARRLALDPVGRKARWELDHAMVMLEERADPAPLRAALDSFARESLPGDVAGEMNYRRVLLAYFTRNWEAIPPLLQATPGDELNTTEWVYPKAWFAGVAARARGDADAARAAFAEARGVLEKMVERTPRSFKSNSLLAVVDAALGDKDKAVREARHALELVPRTGSATVAPGAACNQAVVYAWTDQPDQALALLDDLTRKPAGTNLMYQPTYGDLRLNPIWDPLRGDSRFAAVLQRLAPKDAP